MSRLIHIRDKYLYGLAADILDFTWKHNIRPNFISNWAHVYMFGVKMGEEDPHPKG